MSTKPITLQVEENSLSGARRSFPKDLGDFEWTIRQIQQAMAVNMMNGAVAGNDVVLIMTGKIKQPTTIEGEVLTDGYEMAYQKFLERRS